jgi:cytochrome c-type biogenesis protein CcmH
MTHRPGGRALVASVLVAVTLVATAAPALATQIRASYTDVINDVMCVSCHEPLALAQSPQAITERAYVKQLIAQGLTKAQVERELVTQYGEAVLGKPPASGFNLTVYILPPALLVGGIAVTLPKWRRRAKAAADTPFATATGPAPTTEDEDRLDDDLAAWDNSPRNSEQPPTSTPAR